MTALTGRRILPACTAALAAVAALALTACYNGDDYVTASGDGAAAASLFRLESDVTELPADGFSSAELAAVLGAARDGAHQIRFTTTAGAFRRGEALVDTLVVDTDADGRAVARLVSERTATTAHVHARVVGLPTELVADVAVAFLEVDTEQVIVFESAPTSAPGFGLATVPLSVRITDGIEGPDRKVDFLTTAGRFVHAESDSQAHTVEADAEGLATVWLRTPDDAAQARITATVSGFTADTYLQFEPVPADTVLQILALPDSVDADGASLTAVSVHVHPALTGEAARTVTLRVTHGEIVGAVGSGREYSTRANGDDIARFQVQASRAVADAVVRAEVHGFVQEAPLRFAWAAPDTVEVDLQDESLDLAADGRYQVTARLRRDAGRGSVPADTAVHFTALADDGQALPGVRFADVTRTDADGQVTAELVLEGTAYRGAVTLVVEPAPGGAVGRLAARVVDP